MYIFCPLNAIRCPLDFIMGQIHLPQKVKLFTGLIFNQSADISKLKGILIKKFGAIDFESQTVAFDYTDYYCPEMGNNTSRQFISFERLIPEDKLVGIKLYTQKLEIKFGAFLDNQLKRNINLDPGYIALSKLVLATTKDFSHRIYLGKGIYAEVTLVYSKEKGFGPLPWTYPDYKAENHLKFFNQLRNVYKRALK